MGFSIIIILVLPIFTYLTIKDVIIFSREKTEIFARRIANNYTKKRDSTKLHKIIYPIFEKLTIKEKELLNYDEILWMWTRGVSYHHAGMVPLIKETVELLFMKGLT